MDVRKPTVINRNNNVLFIGDYQFNWTRMPLLRIAIHDMKLITGSCLKFNDKFENIADLQENVSIDDLAMFLIFIDIY